jgi:hypothetical protein
MSKLLKMDDKWHERLNIFWNISFYSRIILKKYPIIFLKRKPPQNEVVLNINY